MGLAGKKIKISLCCLASLVMLALYAGTARAASTHVPVGSWVYPALERLEAEGLVRSGILTSRPLSRTEAARIISEIESQSRSNTIEWLIRKLRQEFAVELKGTSSSYLKPLEEARFRYVHADGAPHLLNLNNDGDEFGNGSNFRAAFKASAGAGGVSAFYLNPEIRYPEAAGREDLDAVLLEGYATLELLNLELTAGRQSLWWGPGNHGALLLSNNARPFDLLKVTNPKPVVLPWLFRYLGPLKLTAFATILKEERDYDNPYLAGMRLDLKPHPNVTIGIARTAMFGGAGRHVDLDVIWDVITASNENMADEPGNQLGAVDLKIVLPFEVQKVVIYGELGGEDEAGSLPSRAAYIAGAYLPGFFGFDSIDLRVEYGQTYNGRYPGVWYTHHLYTSGYTYGGRIIGHHMGTDAKELFASAVYRSDHGDFELLIDLEESGRAVKSRNRSAAITWARPLSESADISLGYAYDRQTSVDGVVGSDKDSHSVFGGLNLSF